MLASKRASSPSRRSSTGSSIAPIGLPAALDDRRRRRGAPRRPPVVRARLLRAGQRLLRRVGRDQPRPRHLHRLDRGARARVSDLRAADADRERTVVALREHTVEGRLTLEEFAERSESAWAAATERQLDELVRDLPAVAPARRRSRLLVSIFSSTVRSGRLRVGRRAFCGSIFGNVDLDLRAATLEARRADGLPARALRHRRRLRARGRRRGHRRPRRLRSRPRARTGCAAPDAPCVRVVAVGLFGGLDLWRVPIAWRDRSFREVIKGIRSGAHGSWARERLHDRRDDGRRGGAPGRDGTVCFVGIGLPSLAANLARAHARAGLRPDLRVRHDRREADRAAALDRRRRARRDRRLPSSRCRRCSRTGCRAAASTSASSAPRRSTGTAT